MESTNDHGDNTVVAPDENLAHEVRDGMIVGPHTAHSNDNRRRSFPTLLCIGGHDPCGGAGVQADAEAARAAGVHACSVITCLTTQTTRGIQGLWPQPAEQVAEQCRLLFEDSDIRAIKIGVLGSSRIIQCITDLIDRHPKLPVVLDPVLAAGAGQPVADAALLNQLRKHLIGRCTLITPNVPEAATLSDTQGLERCAKRLLATGCRSVFITGTHAQSSDVVNRLYGRDGTRRAWSWPRLPGEYHGSGCTLASAIAARLALGADLIDALTAAQRYTWDSLERAFVTGRCALTPNRLYKYGRAE